MNDILNQNAKVQPDPKMIDAHTFFLRSAANGDLVKGLISDLINLPSINQYSDRVMRLQELLEPKNYNIIRLLSLLSASHGDEYLSPEARSFCNAHSCNNNLNLLFVMLDMIDEFDNSSVQALQNSRSLYMKGFITRTEVPAVECADDYSTISFLSRDVNSADLTDSEDCTPRIRRAA